MKKCTKYLLCFFSALLATVLLLTVPAVQAVEYPAAPAQTAFDRTADTCPCCNVAAKDISWTELANISSNSNLAAGHYVVSSPMQLGAYYNITGTKKVVIVFEATLTAKNGANALRVGMTGNANCQTWLLGGTNGKITGTGMTGTNGGFTANGGLMRFGSSSVVTIGGALTVEQSGTATNGRGGLFDIYGGNVTMTGGTLNGITSTASVKTYGAVVVRNGGSFTMTGGIINGGTVTQGGAIYISTEGSSSATIEGDAYINCSGKTVSGCGSAFYVAKGTLNINGGTVIGGTATENGGTVYAETGTVNLSGGTVYGGSADNGGAVYMNEGTLNLSGATVTGGTATSWGGNIYVYKGSCTMSGGTVSGGSAKRGGSMYLGSSFDMSGGTVTGGSATQYAGNIFLAGTQACSITGGTIQNGTSQGEYMGGNLHIYGAQVTIEDTAAPVIISGGTAYEGGNISVPGAAAGITVNLTRSTSTIENGTATLGGNIYSVGACELKAGTISGGTATSGGSIYLGSGTFTLSGGTVSGGTATANGGSIYQAGGEMILKGTTVTGGSAKNGGCVYVNSGATFTMSAGEMKLGTATSQGAIGFIKGTFNMSGGTVTANKSSGGNARGLRVHDGTVNLSGNANIISCAKSTGDGLNVVSAAGLATVSLDGNAQVWSNDNNIKYNIVFHHYHDGEKYMPTMLKVKSGWTGKASVQFGHFANTTDGYAPGNTISTEYAASEGSFAGQLYLENDATLPRIYGRGTALGFLGVEVQTLNGFAKNSQWFETNAQAVAAYAAEENENKLLKLYTDDALDLAGNDVFVDFNGHSVAVTLSGGKLYGLDSTATTKAPGTAAVTVTDGEAQLYVEDPVSGKRAVALTEETTTFHTVAVDITSANVRPGAVGVYYSARITCDDAIKPYVDRYGVAVSLVHLPGEDFEQDIKTIYVNHDLDKLGQASYNGVLVENIMKTGLSSSENKRRAEKPVYANAYMHLIVEGQPLMLMARTTSQLSLKDAMQRINGMWNALRDSDRALVLEKLYDAYVTQFPTNDWDLFNMDAEKTGTPVTRELKILTIGNSLSVDATRMLAYIAQQEGSSGIKIGTLYHANCSLQEHADFLTNDKAEYWYYESGFNAESAATFTEGSLVPKETKSYIGKDAIVAEDWDIIIMQHSVFHSAKADTYDESIDTIIRYVNAHKTNPNAVFAWNMTWMGPVDSDLLATASTSSPGFDNTYKDYTKDTLDREAQTIMYEKIVSAVQSKIATDNSFVYLLPSATMMQNALNATSDKVMYRDYIHGSDYGRLMNGYLWYSILTGKTVTAPAVTKIPGALRFAAADQTSDLALTQRQQNILVEAVNNAIETPYAATESQYSKDGTLNVLAIGNSFAQDATYYLDDIARAQGYTNVEIAYLFIGGCTLKTHATNMSDNLADYTYYTNFGGKWVSTKNYTMEQAITSRDWDVITLQQASHHSGKSDTYEPYLGQLVDYVRQKQPNAKILWHMTWAYQQDSTHSGFPLYNNDQTTMYNSIVNAYNTAVVPYITSGDMDGLLACGTAIQNARTSFVGDTLTRDGYHMSPLGRYLTGCLWYSYLTGETLTELDLTKVDSKLTLTDREKAMVIESVNNAIATPTAVTPSADQD